MSAVADSERNFHVTNWKYWNVVGRFSWIVVLMTHTSCKGDFQPSSVDALVMHYRGPAKVSERQAPSSPSMSGVSVQGRLCIPCSLEQVHKVLYRNYNFMLI